MSKPKDPFVFVSHIYDAIQGINKYKNPIPDLKAFIEDDKAQDAIIRKLEIIGEATNNLSTEFQSFHPEVNWRGPVGLRNLLIHQYFDIDIEAVWDVINNNLPELEKEIKKLLDSKS